MRGDKPFGGPGEYPVLGPLYRADSLKDEIDAILEGHDAGNFQRSAGLFDQMMTEDRLRGLVGTRADGLLACPIKVTAAMEKRAYRKVAETLGGNGNDNRGCWRDICPPQTMRQLLEWGWFLGVAVAEQVYDTKTGLPQLVPWHPGQLRWDHTFERFVLNSKSGQIYLPRPDIEKPDGRWFIWCPFGVKYGWRRGFVRALGEKYLSIQWGQRDWNRSAEKHGMAIIEAKIPAGATGTDKERFLDGLQDLGSEAVVFSPQGSEGQASYGIELKEATSNNWQTFKELKASLQTDFAILLLGQDLPTESKGGGGLGNGTAKSADAVRDEKKAEDAEIADALRDQVFAPWVEYTTGDRELTPFVEFQVKPDEDKKAAADAHVSTSSAIKGYQDAGVEVDADEMARKAGAPLLTPEEAAAKRAERDARAIESAQAMADAAGGDAGASDQDAADSKDAKGKPAKLTMALGVVNRYEFQGLPIAVENQKGSTRLWRSEDGRTIGSTQMLHDYGFIEGYTGGDGEELDCYVGPDENAPDVHVVHQLLAPEFKKHDEDKIFLGFTDAAAAKDAFLAHRNDVGAFGSMSTIPLDRFKARLKRRAPDSTSKIRASITALSSTGQRKVARYVDQLDANASKAGAKAMRPFLETILGVMDEVIAGGGTFEDVKVLAAKKLGISDGAGFATITKHSRIMAYLGGRADVLAKHNGG